ncbi:MAG: hypothetical protein MUD01_09635 [Chloroflexaceae bacterium]|jgi:Tfp pilus assembly protein PilF|nr:hypothetical protein [Chloroflexaceae bacterium]
MNEQIAEWLYDGAVALQQGDRELARDLLMRVVEADETVEEAWLWLSGAVEDEADQRTALENVLALNPANEAAKRGLAWLDANA